MTKLIYRIILIIVVLLSSSSSYAFFQGVPPPPPPGEAPGTPIDGNLILLTAAAVAYGIKKIKK